MSKHKPDWIAEFKDKAGDTIFIAGGEKNPTIVLSLLLHSHVSLGLLQMEENELAMMRVNPLREQWDHIVVNAEEFGIKDKIVNRDGVSEDQIKWSQDQANENAFGFAPPASE